MEIYSYSFDAIRSTWQAHYFVRVDLRVLFRQVFRPDDKKGLTTGKVHQCCQVDLAGFIYLVKMLFKQSELAGIRKGSIKLAYRKWTKPSVKEQSLIHTSIGQVRIESVEKCTLTKITDAHAGKAGYSSREDLLKVLRSREGTLYKITLSYFGADPRVSLREKSTISTEDVELLKKKLASLDRHSKTGAWTSSVLRAIQKNPGLRAADLARKTGKEKDWLKPNIRKLKNLGLTISHEVGYSLSPRGTKLLTLLS